MSAGHSLVKAILYNPKHVERNYENRHAYLFIFNLLICTKVTDH